MRKILFPGSVLIGSGILKEFAILAGCYGRSFVFIGGERALDSSGPQLEESFKGTDFRYSFVPCARLSCASEFDRVDALEEVQNADVICGVGGGSSMDISKAVAFRRGLPLIMLPTTASSDAPCTSVYLTYSEDGSSIVSDHTHHKGPDLVMIDSAVIADAPARLLAAGIGDALTTWYEGSACYKNPRLNPGITETALMLSKLCRTIVMRDGLAAYEAVKAHAVTPQLESVLEANCFLSGVGGLNTGCACAHGFGDWLCSVPGGHGYMHGERVFTGLILQLILEKYPINEILDLMRFGYKGSS